MRCDGGSDKHRRRKENTKRETQHQTQPSQVGLHLHQPKIIDNHTDRQTGRYGGAGRTRQKRSVQEIKEIDQHTTNKTHKNRHREEMRWK